jgi:hypothetical protein
MFTYEAEGIIRIAGCAGFKGKQNFIVLFLVGSRAYIKKAAIQGKIQSVVIKKINRLMPEMPSRYGIQPEVMYVDTLNRIWAEDELTTEENAVDYATAHWTRISEEGRIMFEEDGCYPIKPEGCR